MANTQATNRTVTIEGYNLESGHEYGPTDVMQADSVLITAEKLKTVGAEACRVGYQWKLYTHLYDTVSSVATGHNFDPYNTLVFEYWDPFVRTANTTAFTFKAAASQEANPGLGEIDAAAPATLTPGMYRFRVYGTDVSSNLTELFSGWIEIRAQYDQ